MSASLTHRVMVLLSDDDYSFLRSRSFFREVSIAQQIRDIIVFARKDYESLEPQLPLE